MQAIATFILHLFQKILRGAITLVFIVGEYTANAMDIRTKDQLFGANGH
jgi:hypothetical protein